MAAVIGGADGVHLYPFDEIFDSKNDFARSIATNIHLIMQEEAHVDKVKDPATGSYYIEHITAVMAEKAWVKFQDIEKRGGYRQCIDNGFINAGIEEIKRDRIHQIATRQKIIVGVNRYVETTDDTTPVNKVDVSYRKIYRDAAEIEYLKDMLRQFELNISILSLGELSNNKTVSFAKALLGMFDLPYRMYDTVEKISDVKELDILIWCDDSAQYDEKMDVEIKKTISSKAFVWKVWLGQKTINTGGDMQDMFIFKDTNVVDLFAFLCIKKQSNA